jgi:hypothetical protein
MNSSAWAGAAARPVESANAPAASKWVSFMIEITSLEL